MYFSVLDMLLFTGIFCLLDLYFMGESISVVLYSWLEAIYSIMDNSLS